MNTMIDIALSVLWIALLIANIIILRKSSNATEIETKRYEEGMRIISEHIRLLEEQNEKLIEQNNMLADVNKVLMTATKATRTTRTTKQS